MPRSKNQNRQRVETNVWELRPGGRFALASKQERAWAASMANTRRQYDQSCPEIVVGKSVVVAIAIEK